MHGFQVQQSRWAKGLTQVAFKLVGKIWKADIPMRTKIEAILHLTPNVTYPLMIVVSALMLPVMIVRFYMGWWQMLLIDFPLIFASFWSISAFYVIAYREVHPKTWGRALLLLPMLMAVGIGLTVINTRAVCSRHYSACRPALCGRPNSQLRGQLRRRVTRKTRSIGVAAGGCRGRSWHWAGTS